MSGDQREVIISREQHGTTNGKPLPPRCYVTGPHFGTSIFSGTQDESKASRFSRSEAEMLVAKRSWQGAIIHDAPLGIDEGGV